MAHTVDALFAKVDSKVWLVTARMGEQRGGLIATFVNPASLTPRMPRVLVGLARTHFTWELVQASGAFGLHLLSENNIDWVWHFGMTSGRERDKFAGMAVADGETGSPLLEGSLGWLDCRVEDRLEIGDRTLFLAAVVASGPQRDEVALTASRILQMATPEQRQEMKGHREADAKTDEVAIEAWRMLKNFPG